MSEDSYEVELKARLAARQKAVEAFRTATGNQFAKLEDFKTQHYLTAPYKDTHGRGSVEARLYQDMFEPELFRLAANLGGVEPLQELKEKLEALGLKIGSIRKGG
ncbi:MAG: hypothetical protein HY397_01940 [Candidatus Doudnabacteria bacterium]|nr:hypothetical protein [Candidatus Doudnabacteria bacterium]